MDCTKFSQLLELTGLRRTGDTDGIELGDHLEHCAECRRRFNDIRENDFKIKRCLEEVEVPEGLRSTIISNYRYADGAERPKRPLVLRYLPLTAAVFLLLILGHVFLPENTFYGNAFAEIVTASVEHHNSETASHFEHIEGHASPAKTKEWCSGALGCRVRVPEFGEKLDLRGGKKCKLSRKDAACLQYSKDGKRTTLLIFNDGEGGIGADPKVVKCEGKTVAVWRENGTGYCMVSDSDEEEVREYLACCQGHEAHCMEQKNK